MTKESKNYPSSREIIYNLGIGTLLLASIFSPGVGILAGRIYKLKKEHDWMQRQKQWKRFNLRLLKRNLKRLHDQKIVEVLEEKGERVVKLTTKGRTKFLRFKLEELSLKSTSWDNKWRVLIYDISRLKKSARDNFRRILKNMNFLALQESVYLTPYKCDEEIIYLREYFDLDKEVILMEVVNLENENLYKEYFGF